jgi:hypothetical protein
MNGEDQVAQAIRNRELVLFAGSGFSRDAGLPTWPELVQGLSLRLGASGALSTQVQTTIATLSSSNALPAALEVLHASVDRKDIARELRSLLEPKRESRVVQAAAGWHLKGIVTTNFDRVTDLALGNGCYRIFNDLSSLKLLTTAVGSPGQYLWKLHGDVDLALDPSDPRVSQGGAGFMVLSKSDFTALVQGERGRQLLFGLHTVLMSHPILFVGYSRSDPDIAWMIDLLTESSQFPKCSWFLCLRDQVPASLPKNVEPLPAISDWTELPDWMESMTAGASKRRSDVVARQSPTELSAEERQAYITISRYLSDLESPDLSERVVASALIDEIASARQFEMAWLAGRVQQLVGVGPGLARSLAEATVNYLVAVGTLQVVGTVCQVQVAAMTNLTDRASSEWTEQRARFFKSVARRLPASTQDIATRVEDAIDAVLIDVCSELGEAMAQWVSRSVGGDIGWGDLRTRLQRVLDDDELVRQGELLLHFVLTDPSDDEIPYLYRLLAATFLANSVRLNPVAAMQLQEALSQYELYLDANVILPLVVAEHPAHSATAAVLMESARAGVKLKVLHPIYVEVTSHREIARREFADFEGDMRQLHDLSSALGSRTNVFTSGYLNFTGGSSIAAQTPWQDYLARYSDGRIQESLEEASIEIVRPATEATRGQLYDDALAAIGDEWRRRIGNRRDAILDQHEAVQMAHIYLERERDPSRRQHIWFLSNETVLRRVFDRQPSRWVLPATFPYSAWTAFLDSRMPWASSDPRAIVRAILKSQPQAFDLPSPVMIVRERAFGNRVTSREEEQALELATSDFALMKKVEAAQRAVYRRGNNPKAATDLGQSQREAVAEITDALGSQISRLQAALTQKNERLRAAAERIKELEHAHNPGVRGKQGRARTR